MTSIPLTRLPQRRQSLGTQARSLISGAELAEAVKELLHGQAPGVDEIPSSGP